MLLDHVVAEAIAVFGGEAATEVEPGPLVVRQPRSFTLLSG